MGVLREVRHAVLLRRIAVGAVVSLAPDLFARLGVAVARVGTPAAVRRFAIAALFGASGWHPCCVSRNVG